MIKRTANIVAVGRIQFKLHLRVGRPKRLKFVSEETYCTRLNAADAQFTGKKSRIFAQLFFGAFIEVEDLLRTLL